MDKHLIQLHNRECNPRLRAAPPPGEHDATPTEERARTIAALGITDDPIVCLAGA